MSPFNEQRADVLRAVQAWPSLQMSASISPGRSPKPKLLGEPKLPIRKDMGAPPWAYGPSSPRAILWALGILEIDARVPGRRCFWLRRLVLFVGFLSGLSELCGVSLG